MALFVFASRLKFDSTIVRDFLIREHSVTRVSTTIPTGYAAVFKNKTEHKLFKI